MPYAQNYLSQTSAGPARHRDDVSPARRKVLVLGLGNTLLTDDAAGVLVVGELQKADDIPDDVSLLDGGTLSFSLLAAITDADGLVVVDAARMDTPPGTVRCFSGTEMDRFLARRGQCSVHELGLTELLDMARLQGRLPDRRALVAIEPENLAWGAEPSGAVTAAIPEAVARAREWIATWRTS